MIEKIRSTFSKGNIVISDKGVTVLYTYKDRWITQEITSEFRAVFADLLRNSDELLITHKTGKFAKLHFHAVFDSKTPVIFQPIEEEMSIEEIREIIDSSREDPEVQEAENQFFEFFMGVDLEDDDAVFEKLREWVNKVDEERKTNVRNLSAAMRWKTILNKATLLAGILDCGCEVFENSNDYDGSVTLFIPQDDSKITRVFGKSKDLFAGLLESSIVTSIEISVMDGYINITFYA